MVSKLKDTVKSALSSTIFSQYGDGDAMLLVLVFYMGIEDGGKKVTKRTMN